MKSVGDLTELEVAQIGKARAELREAALRFAGSAGSEGESALYMAAREFDRVCVAVGMGHYWKSHSGGFWYDAQLPPCEHGDNVESVSGDDVHGAEPGKS